MEILFPSLDNSRDLGGTPTADGRVVRSCLLLRTAHLHDISDADAWSLQHEYRLCRIFDFRSLGESRFQPDREITGAEHYLLPTIDTRAELATGQPIPEEAFRALDRYIVDYSFQTEVQDLAHNLYPSFIRSEFSQLQYATFLRLIVEAPENRAVLWHCAQGKDRTGWGAAFVLFALGADRDTVITDFDYSNHFYRPIVERLCADVYARGGGQQEADVIQAMMGVSTPNFIYTLNLIDREFGGMSAYLRNQLLLTDDDLELLRHKYLTER